MDTTVLDVKQRAKEAKERLKSGYWLQKLNKLALDVARAKEVGVSTVKVRDFYRKKIDDEINHRVDYDEAFYEKVKRIVDEHGESCNALGLLTDKAFFSSLSYEQQERYIFNLSEKYRLAIKRYRQEKELAILE